MEESVDEAENPVEEIGDQTEVNENSTEHKAEKADNTKTEKSSLNDEFCSDKDYLMGNASSINSLVDELIVNYEKDWKDAKVVNFIEYNLKIVVKIEKELQ